LNPFHALNIFIDLISDLLRLPFSWMFIGFWLCKNHLKKIQDLKILDLIIICKVPFAVYNIYSQIPEIKHEHLLGATILCKPPLL
jgi:hypothetical protein